MKKILTAALSLALLGAIAIPVLAADSEPPQVIAPAPQEAMTSPGFAIEIDGEDAGAQAHVMAPLRAIAEKLGFTVTWNNGVITVAGAERYAELAIGMDQYFAAPTKEGVLGASLFSLGCAPVLMNDAAYVPVELFDALLGCKEGTVILEGNTVKINIDPSSMNSVRIPSPFTDRATLADAAKVTGFPMSAPDTLEAYSYLHNLSDAEEVLQDTLIQFLKTAPALDGPKHEKAWLLRVAANLSKNRLDYNRVRAADELNEELIAEERKDLSFVWEAVKALPVNQREAVHLFYHEGFTTAEIAAMLGRRESTVRSDLRRGRTKLKEILKEAYDFEKGV